MSFWLLHKWMKVRVKSRQQIRKLWQYIRWEKKYNVSAIRDIVWRQLTRCDSEEVDVIKEHVRVCSRSNCWHLLRQKSLEEKHIVNIISFSDLYVSFRPLLRISNPMTPAMCRGFRYLYFHFRSSTSLAISFWLFLFFLEGKLSLKLLSEAVLFYPLPPKPEIINKSQPFAKFPFRIIHFPAW